MGQMKSKSDQRNKNGTNENQNGTKQNQFFKQRDRESRFFSYFSPSLSSSPARRRSRGQRVRANGNFLDFPKSFSSFFLGLSDCIDSKILRAVLALVSRDRPVWLYDTYIQYAIRFRMYRMYGSNRPTIHTAIRYIRNRMAYEQSYA